MKTFFTQYKWLAWILVILVIINISAIGTIIYTIYNGKKVISHSPVSPRISHMQPGIFMREELDLSDKQFEAFLDARSRHQDNAGMIHEQMADLKWSYLSALMTERVDSASLRMVSDSIGYLQQKLIAETGRYYSEIRKMCNDRQVNKLNAFFKRVIQFETIPNESRMTGRRHENRPMNRVRRMERHNKLNN